MNWSELQSVDTIDQIIDESNSRPIIIFKHSTRCSISAASLDRLERRWDQAEMNQVKTYFLDLIRFRDVSNAVAEKLNVRHQSPQVIVLRNGKVVHDASHFGIDYQDLVTISNNQKAIA